MNRRTFLSSVSLLGVGALSGCSRLSSGYVGGYTATTRESLPPDFDGLAYVDLVSVDSVRERRNVRLDAEMVRQTVTTDHTARIEVTMENLSEEHPAYHGHVLFSHVPWRPERPAVSLHWSLRSDTSYKTGPDCWKPGERVLYGDDAGPGRVEPGETHSITVDVWGHRQNPEGVCLPSGTFSFSKTFEAADGGSTEFDWGFAIDVSKP